MSSAGHRQVRLGSLRQDSATPGDPGKFPPETEGRWPRVRRTPDRTNRKNDGAAFVRERPEGWNPHVGKKGSIAAGCG